jgi:hypothetical protein
MNTIEILKENIQLIETNLENQEITISYLIKFL